MIPKSLVYIWSGQTKMADANQHQGVKIIGATCLKFEVENAQISVDTNVLSSKQFMIFIPVCGKIIL